MDIPERIQSMYGDYLEEFVRNNLDSPWVFE